jgi:hypothetical protein
MEVSGRDEQFHLTKSEKREKNRQPVADHFNHLRPEDTTAMRHNVKECEHTRKDDQRLIFEMGAVAKKGSNGDDVSEKGNKDPL